jgi:hypothetical protein
MTYHNIGQGKDDLRLNNIIDKVLNRMLGQRAAQTFFDHLESTHSIQRQNIAHEMASFNSALREYFGAGAGIIEQAISKNMEFVELEPETSLAERARMLKLV